LPFQQPKIRANFGSSGDGIGNRKARLRQKAGSPPPPENRIKSISTMNGNPYTMEVYSAARAERADLTALYTTAESSSERDRKAASHYPDRYGQFPQISG
jgi:hypothetical protein